MSKTKLYYKIPTLNHAGDPYFNMQASTIKTDALTRITAVALREFAESETHGITRRMGVVFIPDEEYNEARDEIKFNSKIEKRSSNDYISIWNGNNEQMVMIRPSSTRQMSLIEFEKYEDDLKKAIKKDQEEEEALKKIR